MAERARRETGELVKMFARAGLGFPDLFSLPSKDILKREATDSLAFDFAGAIEAR